MRTASVLLLISAVALSACGSALTSAQHASFDRVKCEVKALEPLAFTDAEAVVGALDDGRLTLEDAADIAAVAKDTQAAVNAAFAACKADAGAP